MRRIVAQSILLTAYLWGCMSGEVEAPNALDVDDVEPPTEQSASAASAPVDPSRAARIATPVTNSVVKRSTDITWNAVAGADYYWLGVRTKSTAWTWDVVWSQYPATATSAHLENLAFGTQFFATLWTHIDGQYLVDRSADITFRTTLCGNGIRDAEEQCDDGNATGGDGCSDTCGIEAGWRCTGDKPSTCAHIPPTTECTELRDGSFELGSAGAWSLYATPRDNRSASAQVIDASADANASHGSKLLRLTTGATCDEASARQVVRIFQAGTYTVSVDVRELGPVRRKPYLTAQFIDPANPRFPVIASKPIETTGAGWQRFDLTFQAKVGTATIKLYLVDEAGACAKPVAAPQTFLFDNVTITEAAGFSCAAATGCGNGVVDRAAGELCDDGNRVDTDACTKACQPATCGDGILRRDVASAANPAYEVCDDGNRDNRDACLKTCRPNVCGDGHVAKGIEACDDGNLAAGDGCARDCTVEARWTCWDENAYAAEYERRPSLCSRCAFDGGFNDKAHACDGWEYDSATVQCDAGFADPLVRFMMLPANTPGMRRTFTRRGVDLTGMRELRFKLSGGYNETHTELYIDAKQVGLYSKNAYGDVSVDVASFSGKHDLTWVLVLDSSAGGYNRFLYLDDIQCL